ncbi:MAG: molybdopterin/thiamine biosynthesis adenylyltransferase [Verrucomicrobiales bacterium]|jgi:molybdopterin/thiamine biosynthesis adenylyltransferase
MPNPLNDEDRQTYAWQLDIPDFGEAAQQKLKNTTALISRVGGLGGPLALQLAAAGVGKLILAHGGDLRSDDLNRQVLMSREHIGKPRAACAAETLSRFKPEIEVEAIPSNITEDNAAELVARADIVFDCAPLFQERFLMNEQCVAQNKPLIDSAMFNFDGQVITIVPGQTPCLACLYPEIPEHWKRRFPVLGAVSALIANIAALEGIKLITAIAPAALGEMILVDARSMGLEKISIKRRPDCAVCGS